MGAGPWTPSQNGRAPRRACPTSGCAPSAWCLEEIGTPERWWRSARRFQGISLAATVRAAPLADVVRFPLRACVSLRCSLLSSRSRRLSVRSPVLTSSPLTPRRIRKGQRYTRERDVQYRLESSGLTYYNIIAKCLYKNKLMVTQILRLISKQLK